MSELNWEKNAPTKDEPLRKALWDAVAHSSHEIVFQPGYFVHGTGTTEQIDKPHFNKIAELIYERAHQAAPPDMSKDWTLSFYEEVFGKRLKVNASFHTPPVGPTIVLLLEFN